MWTNSETRNLAQTLECTFRTDTLTLKKSRVYGGCCFASALKTLGIELALILSTTNDDLRGVNARAATKETHAALNVGVVVNVTGAAAFRALAVGIVVGSVSVNAVQRQVLKDRKSVV